MYKKTPTPSTPKPPPPPPSAPPPRSIFPVFPGLKVI